ncbi:DNA-binding Lrp family transcriptional regulator [Streptomyces sp. BK340]|nr:DNA-binding Lrp family transcriptional regulator [Streptomyces sp. BK340]
MSNVALARELGVSEKTIRNRVARLLDGGTVRLEVIVAEPERPSRMLYLVHTEPGQRFEVADALAVKPEVNHVHLATGAYDMVVAASFTDDATALEFFVREVEGRADIRSADTCHLISEVTSGGQPGPAEGPEIDTELIGGFMIRRPDFATEDDLLSEACRLATEGLSADRALASFLGGPSATSPVRVFRSRGLSEAYIAATIQRSASGRTPVVTRVIETRQHVLVPDARTDPLMAWAEDLVRQEGYVTFLALPMLHGKRVIGVLSLYMDRLTRIGDDYVATAQALADHLGMAWARIEAGENRGVAL